MHSQFGCPYARQITNERLTAWTSGSTMFEQVRYECHDTLATLLLVESSGTNARIER